MKEETFATVRLSENSEEPSFIVETRVRQVSVHTIPFKKTKREQESSTETTTICFLEYA